MRRLPSDTTPEEVQVSEHSGPEEPDDLTAVLCFLLPAAILIGGVAIVTMFVIRALVGR